MLVYQSPTKIAQRRASTLDSLAAGDQIMVTLGHRIVDLLASYPNPSGPPVWKSPSRALLDYYTRKRAGIRAAYFRNRYGRDFWTGQR